jgi:VWFA-related protein
MPAQTYPIKNVFSLTFCCALILSISTSLFAQTPQTGQRPADQDDVVKVFTNLIQTDVMVFDKQGKPVNGLKREDFVLKIDGKEKPIEFFERVTAGSSDEEAQLAAARGGVSTTKGTRGPVPLDRGRMVFFYVDDLHLELQGMISAKKMITKYIEDEMGQNDEVAVTSASGIVGFLQQLTDNKLVLKNALDKIVTRPYNVRDMERPPMTEYQAIMIESNNIDVLGYFVDETIRMNPGITPEMAASMVHGRARALIQIASHITTNSLSGLESLIRRAVKLPGRKLVFFVSDGFFLENNYSTDTRDRVRRIASAAARSGVVIYSMDARGLTTGLPDAAADIAFDPSGRLSRSTAGELTASQDGMFALAHDTGGRAFFNTNDLKPGLIGALKETSFYYLLAWKPEQLLAESRFRKIDVTIPSRSDLVVRVRRGFFDIEPEPTVAKKKDQKEPKQEKPENAAPGTKALQEALNSAYPQRTLPVSLALTFLHTADMGPKLSASMEVPGEFLSFAAENGQYKAALDVLGSFFNEKGQRGATFSGRINVNASADEVTKGYKRDVSYTYPVTLEPGLYQVRVAARDDRSGLVGSAQAWIEVPDLKTGKLALSSLLMGERAETTLEPVSANSQNGGGDVVGLSVSRRFRSRSFLRFLVFAYNTDRSANDGKPDAAITIQVVRDGQPVVTTPLKKIETDGVLDLSRLPYAAEIPLNDLPSGFYRLQVTIIDRRSKNSATQQTRFEIY